MTITYSVEGGDTRITETANALLHVLLVDTTDLFQLCTNLGDQAGRGSSTDKVTQLDFDDPMTAPAEGAAVAVTDPATSNVTVAIARQAIRRQETDLHRITGAPGAYRLEGEWLAVDIRNAITIRRTDLIAALFSALVNNVGATTVDLSVTNIYQAMFQLQDTRNPADPACVLHPRQLSDFQTDLRGETGAVQFQDATDQMLHYKQPGFAGRWHGINFWSTDRVATANAGADRQGAMFTMGAFGYKEASAVSFIRAAGNEIVGVPEFSPAFIELERTGSSALLDATGNYYVGVVELEDDRAVSITTDA